MKIALIGATGFVGSKVLAEALARGHSVTAIARHTGKLAAHKNLVAINGDVTDPAAVSRLVAGHDAVVSAYSSMQDGSDVYNRFVAATKAIYEGVRRSGVKRLLVVGGAGSLEIKPGVQLVDTPEFPEGWREGARGARDALTLLKDETTLDWSFVSPSLMLEPGARTGQFRLGADAPLFDAKGESRISVEDLAVAIVDELEKPTHIRQRFTVGY